MGTPACGHKLVPAGGTKDCGAPTEGASPWNGEVTIDVTGNEWTGKWDGPEGPAALGSNKCGGTDGMVESASG